MKPPHTVRKNPQGGFCPHLRVFCTLPHTHTLSLSLSHSLPHSSLQLPPRHDLFLTTTALLTSFQVQEKTAPIWEKIPKKE